MIQTLDYVIGIICILLGGVALIGWHLEVPLLFQISQHYSPLQYNGAVAFILTGICYLLLHKNQKLFAALFAIPVLLLGLATAWEYVFKTDLIVDMLFFHQPDLNGVEYPGRISLNSAICFITLSILQLLRATTFSSSLTSIRILAVITSAATCAMGLVSIFGYISGVAYAYHWGHGIQMAPQMAILFFVTGCHGLLVVNCLPDGKINRLRLLPATATIFILASSIAIWNALRLDEAANLKRFLETASAEFSVEIKDLVSRASIDFSSFARFWDIVRTEAEFVEDVTFYVEKHSYIKAVAVLRSDRSLQRLIPTLEGTKDGAVLDEVLASTDFRNSLQINNPFGMGFLPKTSFFYFTTAIQNSVGEQQLIIQFMNLREAITPIAQKFGHEGYEYRIRLDRELILASDGFANSSDKSDNGLALWQSARFEIGASDWRIDIFPSKSMFKKNKSYMPEAILLLGLITAFLLGIILDLLIKVKTREENLISVNNKLNQLNDNLAQEINRRKTSERKLKEAKYAADTANRSKSTFLANMSHEIRSPLNAIMGFAELLMNQTLERGERLEYVQTIYRNGQLLGNLIDDILDLTKVEVGKLNIEKIKMSMGELIFDIHTLMQQKIQEKGISLRIANKGLVPEAFVGDPIRIRQILTNLVGNAIKFTNEGSVLLEVSVHKSENNSGLISFTVSDTGIGLSEDQQHRLFQPFTQADSSTTRKYGGTGLGLALSRRLARSLGGDIQLLRSNAGEGSTFEFVMPLKLPPESHWLEEIDQFTTHRPRAPKGSMVEAPSLDGLKILVADDAPDNQVLVSRFLKMVGAEVATVGNGFDAVKEAISKPYDLVLMDIQMPNMNGYQATELLRKKGFSKPVVALTANAMKEERQRCLEHGFTEYLSKPIKSRDLIQTIAGLAAPRPAVSSLADDPHIGPLIGVFLDNMPERLNKLREALSEDDFTTAKRIAHQIKGTAGAFGFERIGLLAGDIEEYARAEDYPKIDPLVGELFTLYRQACAGQNRQPAL